MIVREADWFEGTLERLYAQVIFVLLFTMGDCIMNVEMLEPPLGRDSFCGGNVATGLSHDSSKHYQLLHIRIHGKSLKKRFCNRPKWLECDCFLHTNVGL